MGMPGGQPAGPSSFLADIGKEAVDSIYCLGDIVGYGPNPRECIDRVLSFDQSILGNHDQGALYDPEGFSSGAERAIFWTRDQLEMPNGDPEQMAKRWQFLSELPRTVREGPFTFVHGSVRNRSHLSRFREADRRAGKQGGRAQGAGDGHLSLLQRLPQHLQALAVELRQFVQEEHRVAVDS